MIKENMFSRIQQMRASIFLVVSMAILYLIASGTALAQQAADDEVLAKWTRYRLEVNHKGGSSEVWLVRIAYIEGRLASSMLHTKYPVSVKKDDAGKFTWAINPDGEVVVDESQAGTAEEIKALRAKADKTAGQDHFAEKEISARIDKALTNQPASASSTSPAVLFVFDGSGSMWGQIDGKTKIEMAKAAMSGLVKEFPEGTDIGLVAYGHNREGDCGDIELLAPLGSSKPAVIKAVESINPKGKTPLTQSIRFAAGQLQKRDALTSIVVVSDGKESCDADPCEAAKAIAAAGVNLKMHVVGFDVKQDEAEQLQCIANNGGGKYFSAANAAELAKSFAEVKKEVVEAKPEPIKKEPVAKTIFRDDFNDEFLSGVWVVKNHNADGMILDEGKLNILSMPGDLSNDKAQNVVVYDKKVDYANYNVITEVSTDVLSENGNHGQYVGLAMVQDKDNYLMFTVRGTYYDNYREVVLWLVRSGDGIPATVARLPNANGPITYHLKVEKRKYKYSASYSLDGSKWIELGTQTALGKEFKPALIAVRDGGNEALAEFEYFEIQAIDE